MLDEKPNLDGIFMFELARRARWHDILDLLNNGQPPLYIQLLIMNAGFLAYAIVKGLLGENRKKPQSKRILRTEYVWIAANAAVLYEFQWLPYVTGSNLEMHLRALTRL